MTPRDTEGLELAPPLNPEYSLRRPPARTERESVAALSATSPANIAPAEYIQRNSSYVPAPGNNRSKSDDRICGLRRTSFWLALALALVLVIAIAAAVGVGVGGARANSGSSRYVHSSNFSG